MDVKSKVLFSILAIIVAISVAASYYRFIVQKDYERFYDDYGESIENEEGDLTSEI